MRKDKRATYINNRNEQNEKRYDTVPSHLRMTRDLTYRDQHLHVSFNAPKCIFK